jgi:acyl-CoA reductase-like NAD-dependent aldehyde dehydrogenase
MWKQASQRVAVGLALLALPSLPALAQETQWEQCVSAGRTALEERRYDEAEKQFKAALEEAEGFGPRDPRLVTSLENLADLYHR